MVAWKAAVIEMPELDEISSRLTSCGITSEKFEKATWDLLVQQRKRTRLDMLSGALRRKTSEIRSGLHGKSTSDPGWEEACESADKLHAAVESVDEAAKDGDSIEARKRLGAFDTELANFRRLAGAPSSEPLKFRSERLKLYR